jgi:glycosyltransferase involved in cell wall biosynthesis
MKLTCSILLCTKNRTEEVARFLESVTRQTRLPNEVLVLDGASNPEVERISRRFPQLKVRYETVRGYRKNKHPFPSTRKVLLGDSSCQTRESSV